MLKGAFSDGTLTLNRSLGNISIPGIYAPTSPGSSNQYWRSDGSGTGVWTTPASSPSSSSNTLISAKGAYQGKPTGLEVTGSGTESLQVVLTLGDGSTIKSNTFSRMKGLSGSLSINISMSKVRDAYTSTNLNMTYASSFYYDTVTAGNLDIYGRFASGGGTSTYGNRGLYLNTYISTSDVNVSGSGIISFGIAGGSTTYTSSTGARNEANIYQSYYGSTNTITIEDGEVVSTNAGFYILGYSVYYTDLYYNADIPSYGITNISVDEA